MSLLSGITIEKAQVYSNAFKSSDVSWYHDNFGVMHRYSCTLYHPISIATSLKRRVWYHSHYNAESRLPRIQDPHDNHRRRHFIIDLGQSFFGSLYLKWPFLGCISGTRPLNFRNEAIKSQVHLLATQS